MVRRRLALALLLVAGPATVARAGPPTRLVVKYRPSVDVCVDCLVARGIPLATVTGDASLDRLNGALHVRQATPLVAGSGTGSRRAAWATRFARMRDRYPARAARAPAGAVAPDLSTIYVLELDTRLDAETAAAMYARDPHVLWAEPDRVRRVSFAPNDPYFGTSGAWGQPYGNLWGLDLLHAATGWDVANGAGTVVAVVDTGVDATHPDLAANMWTNPGEIPGNHVDDDGNGFVDDVYGWDFQQNDADPKDQHGHGTHVAGTVAAVGNNGIGVVGMAFGARIMAVRGLGADGSGWASDLARGMVYAVENGADVINDSWGGPGIDQSVAEAVATARAAGVVVVAAAGNEGGTTAGNTPAGIPGVIAVGAVDHTAALASFSNHGEGLSVTAPGVDVLSLRGAVSGPVGGQAVGGSYLRLSGTSMASPHAAGLAAVLLSAEPTLGSDDVRWHLELNAAQPGIPGWEGLRWNPTYGYGIVDAARVFDPPPATTRVEGQTRGSHVRVGTVEAAAEEIAFAFTTHDPVDWTLSTPPWLVPAVTAGTGDATVPADLDATALAPGTYTGTVTIAAPATVDGGATIDTTVHAHADVRVGGPVTIGTDPANFNWDPAVASDGVGTLAAWGSQSGFTPTLFAARLDGGGDVVSAGPIVTGWPWKEQPDVAFDGRNHLVVWLEEDTTTVHGRRKGTVSVKALRVGTDGVAVDATPIVVLERRYSRNRFIWPVRVAFDGTAYTVLWGEVSAGPSRIYVRRVGLDGTLRGKARRIYPLRTSANPSFNLPDIACTPATGTCLVVVWERDGELDAIGKYIDKLYGIRLRGDVVIDPVPHLLLRDPGIELVVGSDGGSGYLVAVARVLLCPGPRLCGRDVVAARVTADGVSLDPDGIRVTVGPPSGDLADARVTSVAFDGQSWLVLWYHNEAVTGLHWHAARIGPDGAVLDQEAEGLLMDPSPLALKVVLAPVRTHTQLVAQDLGAWGDTTLTPLAQRVLARDPPAPLPERAIGSIGPQTVAERTLLRFVVTAPSLPGATISAIDLPEGAVLDAATHVFQWMPGADQAGPHPDLQLVATDGVQTESETVPIVVTEANLSLGGTVRLADGTPVAGAAVLTRTAAGRWTTFSDAQGRYRFTDLVPRKYSVRLDKPTRKSYVAAPRLASVSLASVDRLDVDLVLTPK
jgi:subtilisin family serine protease